MLTRSQVAAAFDQWNAALATLDPEKVADMYAPGAVLLPTLSNKVRLCCRRPGIMEAGPSLVVCLQQPSAPVSDSFPPGRPAPPAPA